MTDNEKIARLDEAVSNLKETVKAGFVDVKAELKEIKDGLVTRVERLEVSKLSASDFVSYKTDIAKEFDTLAKDIDEKHKEHDKQHAKIDEKISSLQNWRWFVVGITTGAVFLAEIIFKFLFK